MSWNRHIKECKNVEPKAFIVVCAANLTASDQCPHDCFKCWYGGNFTIHWDFNGQGYVQHYPSRESISMDFEALKDQWLSEGGDHIKAKMEALKTWLDSDMGKVEATDEAETTVMDANRKLVKVQQLICKKCGKPYGVKTPEGFTQFYAKVEGQTCCCKEVEA